MATSGHGLHAPIGRELDAVACPDRGLIREEVRSGLAPFAAGRRLTLSVEMLIASGRARER